MPGYSKEELERVISVVSKKLADARERVDEREIALHSEALNQLKGELGQMLASEEMANREQESQNAAMRQQMREQESQMQQTARAMGTMGKRRGRQAWSWTKKNAKPMAAGAAAGVATGAAYAHQKAQQGLQKAASGAGYVTKGYVRNKETIDATFLFLLIAAGVVLFEFYSAVNGNWGARIAFYGTVVMAIWAVARSVDVAKHALFAALIVNAGWYLFLSGSQVPFLAEMLSGEAAIAIATLVLLPGFIWYLLMFEPQISIAGWIRKPIAIGFVAILFFAFVFPNLTRAGGLIPAPAGGFDTGEAAGDAVQFTLSSFGDGLGDFVCYLGIGSACSFAESWLGRITEPFDYDATTVHEIQNDRLGVYVRDLELDGAISVTGYSMSDYLPKGPRFEIEAPIPSDQEIDLCAPDSPLKGFSGICDRTIAIDCVIDDVGGTMIQPENTISLQRAIASQGSLFTCRTQAPADDSLFSERGGSVSKNAIVTVTYPFATNTFKLIRAVNESVAYTREMQQRLSEFDEDTIISSGGPIIVQTDESTFIAVGDAGTRTPLILELKAIDGVRLEQLEQLAIYVPDGARLEAPRGAGSGSYCNFVTRADAIAEQERLCSIATDQETDICSKVDPSRDTDLSIVNFCEHSPSDTSACEDLDESFGFDDSEPPGSFYYLSADAITKINADIGNERLNARSIFDRDSNSVQIACDLVIEEPDEFLFENTDVTERAVNIVSSYVVEHSERTSVRYEGTLTGSVSDANAGEGICPAPGGTIPVGVVPLKTNENVFITDVFGSSRFQGKHGGIDLALAGNPDNIGVRASWAGTVVTACTDARGCGTPYGRYVRIKTVDDGFPWTHLYAHLENVNVRTGDRVSQGQSIGTMGSTGASTDNHLHFEVDVAGVSQDPFRYIHSDPDLFERNKRYDLAVSNGGSCTFRAVPASNEELASWSGGAPNVCSRLTDTQPRIIEDAAKTHNLHPEVLFGLAAAETNCDPDYRRGGDQSRYAETWNGLPQSEAGAIGLFQIMARASESSGNTYCSDTVGAYPEYDRDNYDRAHLNFEFHANCAAEILREKWDIAYDNWQRTGVSCPSSYCSCPNTNEQRALNYSEYEQTDLEGYEAAIQGYLGWGCHPDRSPADDYRGKVENQVSVTYDSWAVVS